MGWDCFESERDTAETVRDCIGGDVTAVVDRGGVVYAAVRRGETVSAVVALVDHVSTGPRGRRAYRVKLLDEREGPFYFDAPPDFLAGLSPAPSATAAEWRQRCQLKAAGGNPMAEVVAKYRRG